MCFAAMQCMCDQAIAENLPTIAITNHQLSKVHVGWGVFQLPTQATYSISSEADVDEGPNDDWSVSSALSLIYKPTGQSYGLMTLTTEVGEGQTATWTFQFNDPRPSTSTSGTYKSTASMTADREGSLPPLLLPSEKEVDVP
jgi:hypothetical protein